VRGPNLFFGDPGYAFDDAHSPLTSPGSASGAYLVTTTGTVLSGDPKFVNPASGNFALSAGSPGIDAAGALPSGSQAATAASGNLIGTALSFAPSVQDPVTMQPNAGSNGMTPRAAKGAGLDLGAVEAQ
jgi:hypothetical protein